MKVVLIGQKGIPARTGGIERHVEELSIRLVNLGVEVDVYVRPSFVGDQKGEYKGVRLISLPSIATKHLDAITHTFLSILHLTFINRKVDVIHFQSIGPSILLPLVKILKPRTPIVATFHSQCYFHQKWGFLARWSLRIGEFFCVNWAKRTIAVSHGLKEYAKLIYGKKVDYLPNGVPVYQPVSPDKIQKKWGLRKGDYIFLASRFIRHKGIVLLIKAFRDVKTSKKLVIAGDGPAQDAYVKKVKKLAQEDPRVILTGNQSGKTLKELFSNGYLFVQPSEREGLSIALLEAMSYGNQILSSDIPENKEALADGGFYFKNRSIKDLTSKLEWLLKNPSEAASRIEIARNRTRDNYDWEVIAQKTLQIYNEVKLQEKQVVRSFLISLWQKIIGFVK